MARPSNLVIVESPSKAKTIGRYLGPDYTVKASMGHLRDLPKSTMGVDLEHDFTPQYIPVTGKEDLIKELKKAASDAEARYYELKDRIKAAEARMAEMSCFSRPPLAIKNFMPLRSMGRWLAVTMMPASK